MIIFNLSEVEKRFVRDKRSNLLSRSLDSIRSTDKKRRENMSNYSDSDYDSDGSDDIILF